ncbi:tripartite motif-containing protein 14-like [Petromyzon marinus]|uniref:tripartite motif-containing protein 14-like n=1 Tax=Petromyzon marinus TaxID=7757 RepID=UPI003F6F5D11
MILLLLSISATCPTSLGFAGAEGQQTGSAPLSMAAAAAAGGRDRGLEEELTCSICLHLYVDPVLLGCPHTFCRECIVSVWRDGACACPECRRVLPFGSKEEMRKQLEKNFKLASIVDRFSSLSTQGERPLKELNPSLARVRLLNLDLCAQHGKALAMFCREHSAFVCTDCITSSAHRGHKIMSAEEVGRQAKESLSRSLQQLMTHNGKVAARLNILKNTEANVEGTSAAFDKSIDDAFNTAIKSLEEERATLKQLAHAEQSKLLGLIHGQMAPREKMVAEMVAVTKEVQAALQETNHVRAIQVSGELERRITAAMMKNPPNDNIVTRDLFSSLHGLLQSLSPRISNWKTENAMLRNFRSPTLDEDTLHYQLDADDCGKALSLSRPLRRRRDVTEGCEAFSYWRQALCEEGYTSGLHYWEVDVSECVEWCVGVCYGSMERSGNTSDAELGENAESWCIKYRDDDDDDDDGNLSAFHDAEQTDIEISCDGGRSGWHIDRVGILLDCDMDRLSFYDVSQARVHLHTYYFVQYDGPLFPAFKVLDGSITIATCPRSCAGLC